MLFNKRETKSQTSFKYLNGLPIGPLKSLHFQAVAPGRPEPLVAPLADQSPDKADAVNLVVQERERDPFAGTVSKVVVLNRVEQDSNSAQFANQFHGHSQVRLYRGESHQRQRVEMFE